MVRYSLYSYAPYYNFEAAAAKGILLHGACCDDQSNV